MFSKINLTFSICFVFVPLINFSGQANACCFTMPPKVVKISKWAFSLPNIESDSYIHKSHECPTGYNLESQHSHIVSKFDIHHIINIDIHGYSVCCEETINDYYTLITVKNKTINAS